eukprot:1251230-Amphidinium_carterae.1
MDIQIRVENVMWLSQPWDSNVQKVSQTDEITAHTPGVRKHDLIPTNYGNILLPELKSLKFIATARVVPGSARVVPGWWLQLWC